MEESVRYLYSTGKEAFEKLEFDAALENFLKLTDKVERFADVWNMMGQIYHDRSEFNQAVNCFEKALAINPRYVDVQFNLAVTYSEIGQYDKAQEIYQKAQKVEPGAGDDRIPDPFVRGKLCNMHAQIGDIYHGMGLFGDAIREYEKALHLRPDFPDIRSQMAQTLFDSGEREKAVSELQSVKADRPEFLRGRILLGVFLYSSDRVKEAVKEWKEILSMDPNHQRAKMYLRLAAKSKKW